MTRVTHLLLFFLYTSTSFGAISIPEWNMLVERTASDTTKTISKVPTLQEKFKIKAAESITLQNYLSDLFFKEQLNKNSDILRVFPNAVFKNGKADVNSLNTYNNSLLASQKLGDKKKESDILRAYGNFHALSGELDKSINYYKQALLITEQLNDKAEIIKTNYRLGAISKYKGNYAEAIYFYECAILNATSIKSTPIIPMAYLEIAKIKTLQIKNGEAETLILRKALPLFTRIGDKMGRINSFQALGNVYHRQNRYSEAKWFYIQANTLARKLDDKNNIISSLISLAKVKFAIGHYPLALKDYQEADLIASKNKNIGKLVEVKSGLSDLYYKMGNIKAAGKEIDEYTKFKNAILKPVNQPLAIKKVT
ncbi:MAG TPA: tetratricopeptide repeat protein [Sphingobacteriaceae bacterium]|nr:tetratricopeptide repeat protein [Sphingobacteriaceae bacterium]